MSGVIVLAIGIALVAIAGKERANAGKTNQKTSQKGSFVAGLLICIFGGIFASMLNLALSFSQPLAEAAMRAGSDRGGAENFVWMVILAGGFTVNAIYLVVLLSRNHSWKNFAYPGSGRVGLVGFVMALCWYFDAAAYGHGTTVLGKLGTIAGWPVFVSSLVIFSTIWGFVTGEWKNAHRRARRFMFSGLTVLVIASGFSVVAKLM